MLGGIWMGEVFLARWQFGLTSTYHFLLVPLTLGLSILVAVMETLYVRTGNEMYKKMANFGGNWFLSIFSWGLRKASLRKFISG